MAARCIETAKMQWPPLLFFTIYIRSEHHATKAPEEKRTDLRQGPFQVLRLTI